MKTVAKKGFQKQSKIRGKNMILWIKICGHWILSEFHIVKLLIISLLLYVPQILATLTNMYLNSEASDCKIYFFA